MDTKALLKKIANAKITNGGEYTQFPDGFEGDCVVGTTLQKGSDSFFGERIIVELKAVDGTASGALTCVLSGQPLAIELGLGRLKSLWACCLGLDPTSDQARTEVSNPELAEAALGADAFAGCVVRVRARHKENPRNPNKPIVDLCFAPALDANGEPRRVA